MEGETKLKSTAKEVTSNNSVDKSHEKGQMSVSPLALGKPSSLVLCCTNKFDLKISSSFSRFQDCINKANLGTM